LEGRVIVEFTPRRTRGALAACRLLRVTAGDLDALYRLDLKAYSLVVLNVAREMSRRLRVADGIIAELIANVSDGYLRRS
jgi:hypothetical protein